MFNYPKNLQIIFDKLIANDIKPILVGGFVRDSILNINSNDIDIELYNVTSLELLEKLLKEFGTVNIVGKSFGVIKLSFEKYQLDFSLPRSDNKIASGHKGFEVFINPNMDFKSAASRRDFTINAIGYDIKDRKILDPFEGQKDIQDKTLKAVHVENFVEDPLRVLRAAAFCARFDFKMDAELFTLCKKMSDEELLAQLPKERIYTELQKILLKAKKPSIGFKYLKEINALKFLYPLDNLQQEDYKTILQSLDFMANRKTDKKRENLLIMLAILSSKFDKNQTSALISRLTNEKKLIDDILRLTQTEFKKFYSDSELLFLATKVNIHIFILYNRAIYYSLDDVIFDTIISKAKELNILYKESDAFMNGKDLIALGLKPSKEFSKILQQVYDEQLKLHVKSKKEAIKFVKKLVF